MGKTRNWGGNASGRLRERKDWEHSCSQVHRIRKLKVFFFPGLSDNTYTNNCEMCYKWEHLILSQLGDAGIIAIILGGSDGKESASSEGDLGSIPGLGRSPGEGEGYPLQYSGLENSMDWIAHRVPKSWTGLSDLHFHFPGLCIWPVVILQLYCPQPPLTTRPYAGEFFKLFKEIKVFWLGHSHRLLLYKPQQCGFFHDLMNSSAF